LILCTCAMLLGDVSTTEDQSGEVGDNVPVERISVRENAAELLPGVFISLLVLVIIYNLYFRGQS